MNCKPGDLAVILADVSRLNYLFSYDDKAGRLIRNVTCSNRKAGEVAGHQHSSGYRNVCIDGRSYREHIVIWAMVNGSYSKYGIDHVNGDKSDNRIENLRAVPHAVNCQNRTRMNKNNTSGYVGVSLENGLFRSYAKINGVRYFFGYYKSAKEASIARESGIIRIAGKPNMEKV